MAGSLGSSAVVSEATACSVLALISCDLLKFCPSQIALKKEIHDEKKRAGAPPPLPFLMERRCKSVNYCVELLLLHQFARLGREQYWTYFGASRCVLRSYY